MCIEAFNNGRLSSPLSHVMDLLIPGTEIAALTGAGEKAPSSSTAPSSSKHESVSKEKKAKPAAKTSEGRSGMIIHSGNDWKWSMASRHAVPLCQVESQRPTLRRSPLR